MPVQKNIKKNQFTLNLTSVLIIFVIIRINMTDFLWFDRFTNQQRNKQMEMNIKESFTHRCHCQSLTELFRPEYWINEAAAP